MTACTASFVEVHCLETSQPANDRSPMGVQCLAVWKHKHNKQEQLVINNCSTHCRLEEHAKTTKVLLSSAVLLPLIISLKGKACHAIKAIRHNYASTKSRVVCLVMQETATLRDHLPELVPSTHRAVAGFRVATSRNMQKQWRTLTRTSHLEAWWSLGQKQYCNPLPQAKPARQSRMENRLVPTSDGSFDTN